MTISNVTSHDYITNTPNSSALGPEVVRNAPCREPSGTASYQAVITSAIYEALNTLKLQTTATLSLAPCRLYHTHNPRQPLYSRVIPVLGPDVRDRSSPDAAYRGHRRTCRHQPSNGNIDRSQRTSPQSVVRRLAGPVAHRRASRRQLFAKCHAILIRCRF